MKRKTIGTDSPGESRLELRLLASPEQEAVFFEKFGDGVFNFIRERDWVSFVEIERHLESQGAKYRGDMCFQSQHENLVFWCGMSDEFVGLVQRLLREELAFMEAEANGHVAYSMDGCTMPFPIAKRFRPYKKIHWLPVFLRPHERFRPARHPKIQPSPSKLPADGNEERET